ncbi:MAG: hypothetical protein RIG62_24405 [Cyclobacteriaceae bacterium]
MCIGGGYESKKYKKIPRLPEQDEFETLKSELDTAFLQLNYYNYRITLFNEGLIITQQEPTKVQLGQFGWLTPTRAGTQRATFNVRVEGGWQNKNNDPDYRDGYHIFSNPYVKDIIMTQRCIIPMTFLLSSLKTGTSRKNF